MRSYKKIVVFGCSLTKDNYIDTWADLLSNKLSIPLVNLAERGAGYTYILHKILSVDLSSENLHVIMWPSSDRYDLYVNNEVPHLQSDLEYASWLDGKAPSFIDYNGDYTQDGNGWLINGAYPRGYKHLYYKNFYTESFHVNDAWASIISAQSVLKTQNVNYLMCNSYPLTRLTQYNFDSTTDFNWNLYKKIDQSNFVDDAQNTGFIQLVKKNNLGVFNPHYPNSDSHSWYLENYILPKLNDAH